MARRGHSSSMVTLALEALAGKAPDVSFVHDCPGVVKSGIARGTTGAMWTAMKVVLAVAGQLLYIPQEESGERHLFLATSAKYPAGINATASGVPLADGVQVARGTNGEVGSGVYSIDQKCDSAGPSVEKLLAELRREGVGEKLWGDIEEQFKRVTGTEVA